MGAQVGNMRLAGDAAARQRAAASEGIRMRRAAIQNTSQGGGNPTVIGENLGISPTTAARQEIYAARPGQATPFQNSRPTFAPGLEANPPRNMMGVPPGRGGQELSEKGSPAYEEMMQRIRGINSLQNTGSNL